MTSKDNKQANVPTDEKQAPSFCKPTKRVKNPMLMGQWRKSQLFADVIGFILALNEKVKGEKLTAERQNSSV